MSCKRVGRALLWTVGGGALFLAVGLAAFCVALQSDHRSDLVDVPDWVGHAREDAVAQAQSLGLAFEVGELRHDSAVAVDRIIQQEPAAGSQVRRGRTIRVVVSLGGETLTVPSLIGQPARQAELELRRVGLTPGWETHIHDDDVPASRVIDEAPAAGVLSVSGERVHRLVSDGPRPRRFVMPDLRGRTLQDAQEWITLCGFRSRPVRHVPSEGKRPGTIVGQLPLSGFPIAPRDIVELTVAD
jgi:beta-lactam-binding protein with PASTA domain